MIFAVMKSVLLPELNPLGEDSRKIGRLLAIWNVRVARDLAPNFAAWKE
jgi:hypothetical protein